MDEAGVPGRVLDADRKATVASSARTRTTMRNSALEMLNSMSTGTPTVATGYGRLNAFAARAPSVKKSNVLSHRPKEAISAPLRPPSSSAAAGMVASDNCDWNPGVKVPVPAKRDVLRDRGARFADESSNADDLSLPP